MNAPALGSQVTVLHGKGALIAEVWNHYGGGVFQWVVPGAGGRAGTASEATENILWCHGWHAVDSTEVQAMKVARALGPDSAMDLHEADDAFKKGKMSEEAWLANLDHWDAEHAEGRR